MNEDVTTSPANSTARYTNVPYFICPSDPSSGKYQETSPFAGVGGGVMGQSNYFGNLGTNGWAYERTPGATKPSGQVGVFAYEELDEAVGHHGRHQ